MKACVFVWSFGKKLCSEANNEHQWMTLESVSVFGHCHIFTGQFNVSKAHKQTKHYNWELQPPTLFKVV